MKINRLKSISIDDGYEFKYNNDVMNQCFGNSWNNDSGEYAIQNTGDGCEAWFPKERKKINGEWRPGSGEVNWKNYIDYGGKIIIQYLNPDEPVKQNKPEPDDLNFVNPPDYVFMKSVNGPYRYEGTFLLDYNASVKRRKISRRIGTSIDLSNWYNQINLEYVNSEIKPFLKNIYIEKNYVKQKKLINAFLENDKDTFNTKPEYLKKIEYFKENYSLAKLRFFNQQDFFSKYLQDIKTACNELFGELSENEDPSLNGMKFPDIAFEYLHLIESQQGDHNEAIRKFAGGQILAGKILALYDSSYYLYSLSEEESRFYVKKLRLEPAFGDDVTEAHCLLYFWRQCNEELHGWSLNKYHRFLAYAFPNEFCKPYPDSGAEYKPMTDEDKLQKAIKWFTKKVISKQNNSNIDFSSGYIDECEGYKKQLFKNAHEKLQLEEWDESMIGEGLILDCVIEALNAKDDDGQNNIVEFYDITKLRNKAEENLNEAEDILFRMLKSNEPGSAFDEATRYWGKWYPILSYLMCIRNADEYLPVKTSNHKMRISKLGADTGFLNECSWENYQKFIDIHKEVREELRAYYGTEISLLDAHSFVWSLWDKDSEYDEVTESEPELDSVIEESEPLNSTVVKGEKEGRVIEHYVTKYERNPKNRAAAIKIHGYTCMACGFNYQDVYGDLGKEFIEVHHVKPLYMMDEEIKINPETDLVCLCANCHRMIHKKRGAVLTVEELKSIINIQKNK